MEADESHQVSALLACRSRADLRRLRGMDSPSFPFITLACKHNRADLLNLLLKDDTSDPAIADPRRYSVEQEYEGHDAVYFAIRSSNVELLRTLLGSVTPELSERLISESYEKLILVNVLLSEEMHMFVQYKLLDLRFFSKGDGALPATSTSDIQERVQLLLENIAQVKTYTEVDSHFLYTAKFIAQNIHTLKHLLKSTYNILPWEEMEFCLVSFTSAHIRRQELNLFYLSVLKKERLLEELVKFASALQELEEHIGSTDVQELQKKVVLDREDVATAISSRFPHLYADYKEVRDVTSLHIMTTYLDAALLADSATRPGQLTIKRALQVTGEHLKNTLDSPKLSPAVSDLLLLSAPKETRQVLRDLCNSLSCPHLELEDSALYSNIQNDIKKIASVITDVKNSNKVDKIKCMLTTLINSDSVDEFHDIANVFRDVCVEDDAHETDTATKGHRKIEDHVVDIIRKIEDQTPYEKKLFAEIKDVLDKSKIQHDLTKVDFSIIKLIVRLSSALDINSEGITANTMKVMKSTASKALKNFSSKENRVEIGRHYVLAGLLDQFYKSVSTRIQPEIAVELHFAKARIFYSGTIDKDNIKYIDECSRQLFLGEFNKKFNGEEKCISVENSSELISKQLSLILTELTKTVETDRVCGQLYEHLSTLYKNETTNRFMVEALVLDIMSLLDRSERLHDNELYLDGAMPLLSGKSLHNHLVHENALVDILPTDVWSAVLLNAVKLTESKDLLLKCTIGNVSKHNIKQLRWRYEGGLSILNKQEDIWKSLLDGKFEKFALEIAGGADICSRNRDLSTILHYAARGPNIETVKFLTKQKMISTEARDIVGQTALHIAASYGRDVTVKFLVSEMGNAINQVDDAGKTPLHLASHNGHKKTVVTLLSLGAKTTIKDNSGHPPLHYAIVNNHLDVLKILLEKDATVDENTVTGGFTSLHTATEMGHIEIVQYLLLKKADVNAKSIQGTLPLHLAAYNGPQEVVNALLEKGAHVNLMESKGLSSLYFAVENNQKDIVKILLEKGAFVNNGDFSCNNTPLHTAVFNGNAFIAGLLLQHNADVNARRNDGLTPLLLAAEGGHADLVDLLLENGALTNNRDVTGSTALHIAALHGHTSVVKTLIQRGFNIHTRNADQKTALHLAAQEGHQQMVDILLAAGASVHSIDKEGSTALHLTAGNGHEVISEALLRKKAKIKCKNCRNRTPLDEAAANNCNEKCIKILLKYGANVNEKGENGGTALHLASFAGNSSVVEALLQGKADVDAQAEGGITALYLAVVGNHKKVVEILLKYGANVNHLDSTGSSVLCRAAENNNKVLLDILIAKGASVNVGGGQLLLTAIKAGHRLVVDTLLKNKDIDINIKDKDGSNLLYTAALSGDALIAKALIKRGIKVADCIQDPSPLSIAISFGHTEFVDVMLENGANVNPPNPDESPLFYAIHMNKSDVVEKLLHWGANSTIRDSKNRTALELAVSKDQIPNTLVLLQQEGNGVNDKGPDNRTLLHIAAESGNLEVTKVLVGRGADVNARNKLGSKAIHIAARDSHHHLLAFFLELGMSIDDPGAAGCTLMHYAAVGGQLAVAQFLIDKQVDVNSINLNGSMPIHLSAEQGHTEMVKLLLRNGAVYDAMDNLGKTPAELAKSRDIKRVLESIGKLFKAVKKNDVLMLRTLVKDLEKYIDAKSSDNATLLHIASWKGFQEVCDILLESKANPNAVGKGGNAPLHYASKYSHRGIVHSLLKNGAAYNLKADDMRTPLDFATQKDIKSVLEIITLCFRKVRTRNVKVIKDINKIKDADVREMVMKACDADGNTLVVVAMKCDFPEIDQLKQVSQDIPDILSMVDSFLMLERFTEAIEILNCLLNERTQKLGEDNPGTLDVKYKIALVLYKQCKYFEAMPMLEDIYRKRVEKFGPHHPVSLETKGTMALILHRLGRNKEAWDIFQEIMPKQQEVLGQGHEQLMQTKTHAGMVLHVLGKHDDALRLYTQVYKNHKNTFGARHPDTLRLHNNIAMVLHAQGKPDEAFAIYQSVYETRKTILGLNHSETIRARRNMGSVLMEQNKLDDALEIFQETLAIQKNVFGLNHSDTVYTQGLIKSLYLRQNNLPEALKVHKEGLNARKATLGSNHPDFSKLDGLLDNFNKNLNLNFDVDVGSVPPCDVNFLKAASLGDRGKVRSLIENGSEVNTTDSEGRTALHFASTVEVMELLLDSGADATAVSQAGNTPLHLATSRVSEQAVRLLLQNVKRTKPSAFHKFINAKTAVGGSTALHVAAKKGATDIVSCLLAHGACYNSRDRSDDRTPLQCSDSPYVTRLLRLAEEVFEMAERGGTVLPQGNQRHLAAVVNSRDTENRTPLQVAALNGHTATARLLTGLLKAQD